MRFENGSEEASWYQAHDLHQMWGEYRGGKAGNEKTMGPAPLSPAIYSPCVWPTAKQALDAAALTGCKLLAWNSPNQTVAAGGTAAKESTVFFPVIVNRADGSVTIRGRAKNSEVQLWTEERDEVILKMRDAFMHHVGPLSRVSVNFRFGLLSDARCQVDWRLGSSVGADDWAVPTGNKLDEVARCIRDRMRKMQWPTDYTPTQVEVSAWKNMISRYLAGVIPYGRYNMPSDRKQSDDIHDNWVKTCRVVLRSVERQLGPGERTGGGGDSARKAVKAPVDGGGESSKRDRNGGSGSGKSIKKTESRKRQRDQ